MKNLLGKLSRLRDKKSFFLSLDREAQTGQSEIIGISNFPGSKFARKDEDSLIFDVIFFFLTRGELGLGWSE